MNAEQIGELLDSVEDVEMVIPDGGDLPHCSWSEDDCNNFGSPGMAEVVVA